MDVLGTKDAVKEINDHTLPEMSAILSAFEKALIDGLHEVLDRLDGTRIIVEIQIPPRGSIRGTENKQGQA